MNEQARLRHGSRRALVAVLIGFVLVGGLVAAFGTGRDRAEGAAERWLTELGDTTRKGVGADATRYVAEHGVAAAGEGLLPTADVHGKSAFTGLEVGKAAAAPDGGVRVPFMLTRREHGADQGEDVKGTLVLQRVGDGWQVAAVGERASGEQVPSEGGAAIAKAPAGLYVGGVVVGAAVTAACALLMRRLDADAAAARAATA